MKEKEKFYAWLEEKFVVGYKIGFSNYVIVKDGDKKTLELLQGSDEFNKWLGIKLEEFNSLKLVKEGI